MIYKLDEVNLNKFLVQNSFGLLVLSSCVLVQNENFYCPRIY